MRAQEELDLRLIEAADQQAIIATREQAARNAGQRMHQEVEKFLGDCVGSLRQQTAQLCEQMLESMRSGKTGVHQKTLNRLVRFIDEFKRLNFVGDRQMEAELDRVRQEFLSRTAEEYRDSNAAAQQLQQGLQGLAGFARQLAEQDAYELVQQFGEMGRRKF